MGGVIGETLPLGLGIALNPIAIVVAVVISSSTIAAWKSGFAFTCGWVLGLTVLLVITALIVQAQSLADPESTRTIVDVGKLAFGLMFILGAAWSLRRPRRQDALVSPRLKELVDEGGVGRSFVLGIFLSDFSLKNLALVAAAGSVIGQAGLGNRGVVLVSGIFVVICTIGIVAPLLVRLFGSERGNQLLANWREWLERNVTVLTAGVMIVIGLQLVAQGIAGLR
jgi:threonine/homoserine/homoserine lactone efflux protein